MRRALLIGAVGTPAIVSLTNLMRMSSRVHSGWLRPPFGLYDAIFMHQNLQVFSALRAKGLSDAAIATHLNVTRAVPISHGGWHAQAVRRVFERSECMEFWQEAHRESEER
jgi:hypothetical protein